MICFYLHFQHHDIKVTSNRWITQFCNEIYLQFTTTVLILPYIHNIHSSFSEDFLHNVLIVQQYNIKHTRKQCKSEFEIASSSTSYLILKPKTFILLLFVLSIQYTVLFRERYITYLQQRYIYKYIQLEFSFKKCYICWFDVKWF